MPSANIKFYQLVFLMYNYKGCPLCRTDRMRWFSCDQFRWIHSSSAALGLQGWGGGRPKDPPSNCWISIYFFAQETASFPGLSRSVPHAQQTYTRTQGVARRYASNVKLGSAPMYSDYRYWPRHERPSRRGGEGDSRMLVHGFRVNNSCTHKMKRLVHSWITVSNTTSFSDNKFLTHYILKKCVVATLIQFEGFMRSDEHRPHIHFPIATDSNELLH